MVSDEDLRAIVRAAVGDMHCPAAGYCFIMGARIEFTGVSEMKNTQEDKEDKAGRILSLYSRLSEGRVVNKTEEAERYRVSMRTIQRDIFDIQNYLQE